MSAEIKTTTNYLRSLTDLTDLSQRGRLFGQLSTTIDRYMHRHQTRRISHTRVSQAFATKESQHLVFLQTRLRRGLATLYRGKMFRNINHYLEQY